MEFRGKARRVDDKNRSLAKRLFESDQAYKERLKADASRDALTGLFNRGYLMDQMAMLKPNSKFAIIMMDIDFFKQFNDTHGHKAGDEVLKRVARVLGDKTRGNDVLARYGGEEIVLLMKDVDSNLAERAEILRRSVLESHTTRYERRKEDKFSHLAVTISVGVASSLGKKDATPDDIMVLADQALYQSKQEGRNKVTVFG